MTELICDKCGSEIPPGSRFCPQCADPVTSADNVKNASSFESATTSTSNATASAISANEPLQLVCPKCNKKAPYTRDLTRAFEKLVCLSCRCTFQNKAAKVRAKKSRGNKKKGTRSFSIRVVLLSGSEELVEFVNASYDDFELRSKDSVAFSYLEGELKMVQNLTVDRHMEISKRGCYLATMVYGVNSREVITLRRFRDEVLVQHSPAVTLIKIYYLTSPWVVRRMGTWKTVRWLTRACLDPIVRRLEE